MTLRTSTGFANSWLNGQFNGGAGANFDSGALDHYTGAQPGSADTAPSGTLVASMPLPADAFAAAAAKAVAKSGTWEDASADNAGTMGWARLRTSGDAGTTNTTDRRVDFAVSTIAAGTGELQYDNTAVTATQKVTLSSLTLTAP